MARLLDGLRSKLHQAVQEAAKDMQATMDYQMEYAMTELPWRWHGLIDEEERKGFPYSNGDGSGLMESKKMTDVIRLKTGKGETYAFSWNWDPVFAETGRHYAALVHDGSSKVIEFQMHYRSKDMEPAYETYSARPWTAWVTPYDQRENMSVEFSFVQPVDVPDVGWQFARAAFVNALKTRLQGTTVRVSL